jgi:DNA polymerase phi
MADDLAMKTPWIREEVGMMLGSAANKLDPTLTEHVAALLNDLNAKNLLKTPEGVAIWLSAQSKFPDFKGLPTGVWLENNPLHLSNGRDLRNAMLDVHHDANVRNGKQDRVKGSVWKQTVHFAWPTVFDFARKHEDRENFKRLWHELVDDGIFNDKASLERKSWGFQLFLRLLAIVDAEMIEVIFSENLLDCIIDQAGQADALLHASADKTLKGIISHCHKHPDAVLPIIQVIQNSSASILFDRRSRTRTLAEISAAADSKGYQKLLKNFEKMFSAPPADEDDDPKAVDHLQVATADILLGSFKSRYGKLKKDEEQDEPQAWIGKSLLLFAEYAYCESSSDSTSTVSSEVRSALHSRLSSCFTQILLSRPQSPSHWPWFLIHKLHKLTKKGKDHSLVLQADKAVLNTLKTAYKVVESIQEDGSSKIEASIKEAMILLFCLTLLQAYNGDSEAISLLDDLMSCYNAILTKDTSGNAFELLVEVLLSFISKPSQLFRNMAIEVFSSISSSISEDGLQSLFDILGQSESMAGQQELFEHDDDVDVDEDEDEDDSSMGSDVEMVDGQAENGVSGDSEDDDEDEDDEETEEDSEELRRFDELLAQALKTTKLGDGEEPEESDSDGMDDDQMLELEPQIANVFKQRSLQSNKRKENKQARETVINFKKRVLDLLSVYTKHEASNPLAIEIVLPVLRLVRSTREKSLEKAAIELLRNYYSSVGKLLKSPGVAFLSKETDDRSWKLFMASHEEIKAKHGSSSKAHQTSCSRAALFAARMILQRDKEKFDQVAEVYGRTMGEWFKNGKMGVQPTLFTDWVSFVAEFRKRKG